jgi:hypothetical protein
VCQLGCRQSDVQPFSTRGSHTRQSALGTSRRGAGSHATARGLAVIGRYDGAVLVGETGYCGAWPPRQQGRRAPGLLLTHCPECALARRPAGHQQAASSRGAGARGPALVGADAMSPAKRIIARASQTRPRVPGMAPSPSTLGARSARRAVDQGGRSRSGHLRILGPCSGPGAWLCDPGSQRARLESSRDREACWTLIYCGT